MLDRGEEVVRRERLRQRWARRLSDHGIAGDKQDGYLDAPVSEGRREREPVHAGHSNIGYKGRDTPDAHSAEQLQGSGPILGQEDAVLALERRSHQLPKEGLVIDHDDERARGLFRWNERGGPGHAPNVRDRVKSDSTRLHRCLTPLQPGPDAPPQPDRCRRYARGADRPRRARGLGHARAHPWTAHARPGAAARDRLRARRLSVSPIIAAQWADETTFLEQDSAAAATYLPGRRAPKAGEWFRNADYARTLQEIAVRGIGTFYGGALGRRIVARLAALGGFITLDDLKQNAPTWVTPISVPFRGYQVWELPPNNQGIAALEMLRILYQKARSHE